MIYKQFIIQNYKGIDTVCLDLSNNRIITLVGLNESGKTTILDGIKLFYDLVKGNEPSKEKINEIRPKGIDFTGDIILTANLEFEDEDITKIKNYWKSLNKRSTIKIGMNFEYTYKLIFDLHKHIDTTRNVQIELARKLNTPKKPKKKTKSSSRNKKINGLETVYKVDRDGWNDVVEFIRNGIFPEILFYEDFIFDIPEAISFIPSNNQTDVSDEEFGRLNSEWQLVLDDILKTINSKFSIQEDIVDIWTEDPDTARNRLSKIEAQLNKKITHAWKALFKKGNKDLNFKEIKINAEVHDSSLLFSFKVKTDSDILFSINERSKGCKWFFSFLLFTEFRKVRTKNILFLLDEPASNLHSTAQLKILEAIENLSDKSLVIFSTHSHHLIKIEWLPGAYVVINEKLTESVLAGDIVLEDGAKITAKKYFNLVGLGMGSDKVSSFQPILDALDYQPSVLEPIPDIVILEGKNDWFVFKYFSEIISDYHPFHFYPGAGKDKLWDIIRLYMCWGKHFIVLLDGDQGGVKSKESYIKEFQDLLEGKIFTLRDILDSKGATESLICPEDQRLIFEHVFNENSYDEFVDDKPVFKSKINFAIIQLLVQKKALPISNETKNNFDKIFQFIESVQKND